MQEILDKNLRPFSLFALVVVGVIVAVLVARILLGRRSKKDVSLIDPKRLVDLSQLPLPDDIPVGLRVHNRPAWLGVVVFAPLGRIRPPSPDETFAVLNTIIPGLGGIAQRDQPVIDVWPNQVSVTGFANTFARHVNVPGRDLQETRWCLLAGKTRRPDGLLLVGLAIGMEATHRLGVTRLNDESQWPQFVEVKRRGG